MRFLTLGCVLLAGATACGQRAEPPREEISPGAPPPEDRRPVWPDADPPLGHFPALQAQLPRFTFDIAAADWQALQANPTSNDVVPMRMTLDGTGAPGRVRFRGASTRTLPQKGFKVELASGAELEGRDHFELIAQYLDAGKLTEKFAVDLARAMGLRVPHARYALVEVNGVPQGLYLDMEHVGGEFLQVHGLEAKATIYRAGARDGEMKLDAERSAFQAP
jgi:spore coat protein H